MQPRPTFPSLARPIMVAGGERKPMAVVFGAALICGVTAWFGWNLLAGVTAIVLVTIAVPTLRTFAKRDPQMFEIAQGFFFYRPYYPARTPVPMPKER